MSMPVNEFASTIATRPDATWQGQQIRIAIRRYAEDRRLTPHLEDVSAFILEQKLRAVTDRADRHEPKVRKEYRIVEALIMAGLCLIYIVAVTR